MVATKLVTVNDLEAFGEDDVRRELLEGELIEMSPTSAGHWVVTSRLLLSLADYLKTSAVGHLWGAETGFIIQRDPDTVVSPDIAITTADTGQKPTIDDKGYVTELPILVVEIKSPTDREAQIARKLGLYLAAGVPEVWWVRPQQRQISVHRPDAATETIVDGSLQSPRLPGYQFGVWDLFAP
jgi:Uma2 family endonuclease